MDDVERLFTQTLDRFGTLDIVVANAGMEIIDQPILEATEEQFDRLFAVNTKGAFFTLQKAAKYGRRQRPHTLHRVKLDLFSSPGNRPVRVRVRRQRGYLVGVLALEVGHRGVTVNTILPTAIEGAGVYTTIAEDNPFRQLMTTFRPIGGRLGRPEDVAAAAEYFASDLASWVSGQHLLVSGGAQQ